MGCRNLLPPNRFCRIGKHVCRSGRPVMELKRWPQGRVLVVHESGGTRALLAELLTAEGMRVEAVASTIQCISSFVDEPAEIVLVGLAGLATTELFLISRIIVHERND